MLLILSLLNYLRLNTFGDQSPRIGFHSSSVDIVKDEKTGQAIWTVDVPMRSFQGGQSPITLHFPSSINPINPITDGVFQVITPY
jgi:hypothetical protein